MKIVKAPLLIIASLLLLPALLYAGMGFIYGWTEDRTFETQWEDGFQKADKILIANVLCPTKLSCSENSVSIYVAGYASKQPKGFKINIYGTKNEELLSQLSQVFIDEFHQTPDMQHLYIAAYPLTKHQDLEMLFSTWRDSAVLNIDLKRKD